MTAARGGCRRHPPPGRQRRQRLEPVRPVTTRPPPAPPPRPDPDPQQPGTDQTVRGEHSHRTSSPAERTAVSAISAHTPASTVMTRSRSVGPVGPDWSSCSSWSRIASSGRTSARCARRSAAVSRAGAGSAVSLARCPRSAVVRHPRRAGRDPPSRRLPPGPARRPPAHAAIPERRPDAPPEGDHGGAPPGPQGAGVRRRRVRRSSARCARNRNPSASAHYGIRHRRRRMRWWLRPAGIWLVGTVPHGLGDNGFYVTWHSKHLIRSSTVDHASRRAHYTTAVGGSSDRAPTRWSRSWRPPSCQPGRACRCRRIMSIVLARRWRCMFRIFSGVA